MKSWQEAVFNYCPNCDVAPKYYRNKETDILVLTCPNCKRKEIIFPEREHV